MPPLEISAKAMTRTAARAVAKELGSKGGKNSKRSRRDKSKCVAHDQAGCSANQDTCDSGQRVACGGGSGGGMLEDHWQRRLLRSSPDWTISAALPMHELRNGQECEDSCGFGRGAELRRLLL